MSADLSPGSGAGESIAAPAIVLLVSHLCPTLGLERAAIELARTLGSAAGVTVMSLGDDLLAAPCDLDIAALGPKRIGWRRLRSIPALRRYGRTASADAVYIAVGLWAAIPWLIAAPRQARRTVVWEHSLSVEKTASSRSLRILRLAAGRLYPRAWAVACVSDSLSTDVARLNATITTVTIPNAHPAVDERSLARRFNARTPGGARLLTVGSLSPTKNQQLAIRALAELPATFTLDIAGAGAERSALGTLTRRLAVSHRVRFLGHLDHRAMADAYRRADILVHPSLGETFGYVYVEAADEALPVVSLRHPVSAEMIPQLVPGAVFSGGPAELAAAVLAVRSDPPTRSAVLAARQLRANRMDPAAIRDRWLELLCAMGPTTTRASDHEVTR
ncbi:glycosyltransferase family 4 protein [Nakamurella sp. GG22]